MLIGPLCRKSSWAIARGSEPPTAMRSGRHPCSCLNDPHSQVCSRWPSSAASASFQASLSRATIGPEDVAAATSTLPFEWIDGKEGGIQGVVDDFRFLEFLVFFNLAQHANGRRATYSAQCLEGGSADFDIRVVDKLRQFANDVLVTDLIRDLPVAVESTATR